MNIQFSDLGVQHAKLKREIDLAIKQVIKRGDFILGQDVGLFEEEFAKFCQVKYAVGVSSGTAALFLALKGLGIGPGDEVIIPAFTFIATAVAVSYTGARPVFVDIDEKTYNIDASKIENAITKNTKVIMPVHLYGQPADMQKILEIARKYNLKIVEDSAQAHGSTVKLDDDRWQKAGSVGDCGCFSFYPSKNLGGMGDGGMVVTNDLELSKRVRMLRDCGRTSKYEHVIVGYNSRLDTLQAAMLRVKLKKLEKYNAMRQAAAKSYNKFFKGLQGVIIPSVASFARHVYHVYAIRTKRRNELFEDLKNKGVGVVIHYPIPLHLQKAYANLGYKKGELPVAERVADEIISLPMFPYITQKQIKFVAEAVKDFL